MNICSKQLYTIPCFQFQELLVEFDAEMKKREHEFRQKADEMSNLVLSHELKVSAVSKCDWNIAMPKRS